MTESDERLEYRPISRKRIKIIHVETYDEIIDVLTKLVDKEEHNYIDWYCGENGDNTECLYCCRHFKPGQEEHEENCPIKRGQDLLRSLK